VRKTTFILKIFLLVAFVFGFVGCDKGSSVDPNTETAIVEGWVKKDITSEPFPGILVYLGDLSTRTNDSGEFSFGNLNPGEYDFMVRVTGYAIYYERLEINANTRRVMHIRLIVDAPNLGRLQGQVVDDNTGIPIQGAYVYSGSTHDSTDSNGYFFLEGNHVRTLAVYCIKEGYEQFHGSFYFSAYDPEFVIIRMIPE